MTGVQTCALPIFKPLTKYAYFKCKDNTGIVLDEKNNYQTIDQFKFDKVASTLVTKGEDDINLGDYGFFAVDNNAITKPFKVQSIQKVAGVGNFEILADHGLEAKYYYPISVKDNDLISHETKKLASYVPSNAKFIKLANKLHEADIQYKFFNLTKAASDTEQFIVEGTKGFEKISITVEPDALFMVAQNVKQAELIPQATNEVIRDTAGLYRLNGTAFTKMAKQNSNYKLANLNKHEAIWNSILLGASDEDVNHINVLVKNASHKIKNQLDVPVSIKALEKSAEQSITSSGLTDKIASIPSLIKEAAVMSDKTTVDAVLSLGLINKYNILEFIALVPDYERVAGELAKLLIMTRLGLSNLPERVVKTAMESLTSVIFMLKRINTIAQGEN